MPGVARPHVRIQVAQGIQLAQLEGLLKNIVASQPGGCRTCGLGGFDFSILVNPDPELQLKPIVGAAGVTGLTVGY